MCYSAVVGIASILLTLIRLKSIQSRLLILYMTTYFVILLIAIITASPVDVYFEKDSEDTRRDLVILMASFFVAVCLGTFLKTENRYHRRKPVLFSNLALLVLVSLVIYEFFISSYAGILGNYSNDTKPTYFYSYLSIVIAFYLYNTNTPRNLFYFIITIHIALCFVNGERLMILTTLSTLMFFSIPSQVNLKFVIVALAVIISLLALDNLRSGEGVSTDILDKFIYDGTVTHHGSILYSSLVLVEFSNDNYTSISPLQALSYLFGIDGSAGASSINGFALIIAQYAKRGGGGLLPAFLVALFGWSCGWILTALVGILIGSSLKRFEAKCDSPTLFLLLGFLPHAFAYTPIHLVKGPLLFYILSLAARITHNFFYRSKVEQENYTVKKFVSSVNINKN